MLTAAKVPRMCHYIDMIKRSVLIIAFKYHVRSKTILGIKILLMTSNSTFSFIFLVVYFDLPETGNFAVYQRRHY